MTEPDTSAEVVRVSETADDLSALADHFKARAEAAEAERRAAYDSGYAAGLEAVAKVARSCIYHDSAGNGFDEDAFDEALAALRQPD